MVLDSWSSRNTSRAAAAAPARFARPRVEEIEPRLVPSGTWTPLRNLAPGTGGTMILLSNGTIMTQLNDGSNQWAALTPDATGSYINGTWSMLAPMSENRLYFASNVLPDGRVFVLGGEYSGAALNQNFDNTGEIYDPVANTWTPITTFPQSMFGDDPSALLPNGDILLGYINGPQTYIYHVATNSYTMTGTKLRNDQSDEECFIKLPDNSILDYEVFSAPGLTPSHAQRYIPATGTWVDAGSVPTSLSDAVTVGSELGPGLRLPDGRVLQIGANSNTAIYNPATNTWAVGPTTPGGQGADDAPGAILPNGDLLYAVDTPLFNAPTNLIDFNYTTNTSTQITVPAALNAVLSGNDAFQQRMIVTPSGELLFSDDTNQLWMYTPNGGPQESWRPRISNVTSNGGNVYTLTGQQLNGISEGSAYGDDVENSTNYPIVRITDNTGRVFYARSFNWSSTGVATGNATVSTQFVLPAGVARGPLVVVVIANGIPSQPFVLNGLNVYYPFRWIYNPADGTYRGNLTIQNVSSVTLTGPYFVAPELPPGVKLVNANATTANGAPAVAINLNVAPHGTQRVSIVLLNPLRQPLSTFFIGFPIFLVGEF